MAEAKRRLYKLELDRVDLVGSPANPGAYVMLMKSASDVPVVKIDSERRRVFGFASISTIKGEELVDAHGDVISPADLEDAAALFRGSAGVNHQGDSVGDIFESVYIDAEKADAMGLSGADGFAGWWIGVQLPEGPVWEMAKAGHLPAFSIQGRAQTEDLLKRDFSSDQRQAAADSGAAMPDGSFPIKTRQDLVNAMQSLGRANNRAATIAHIKRRAKALGLTDLLNPDIYKSADILEAPVSNDIETIEAPEAPVEEVSMPEVSSVETVAKADFDAMKQHLDAEVTKAAALEERIAKMERERKQAEFVAKAKDLDNLGTADQLGTMLLEASEGMSAEAYQTLERTLKAANAQVEKGALFAQFSRPEGDAVSAMDRITSLAKAKVDAGQAKTIEIAKVQVMQENPELQSEYMASRSA